MGGTARGVNRDVKQGLLHPSGTISRPGQSDPRGGSESTLGRRKWARGEGAEGGGGGGRENVRNY